MTLTLSATFDPVTAAVELDAASSVDHAYGDYTLTRTDARGTATVRTLNGYGFTSGHLLVTDGECALGGLVTYQITAGAETATDSVTPEGANEWLTFPLYPNLSRELGPVGSFETRYEPRDTWHEVIDRDDAVPTFGPFGQRAGTFQILCDTYADAIDIIEAYRKIRIAYLRIPEPAAASMYHAIERATIRKVGTAWLLEGTYREMARPAGDLIGTLGWTFDDITALGQTFDELLVTFPTFNDMTAGT